MKKLLKSLSVLALAVLPLQYASAQNDLPNAFSTAGNTEYLNSGYSVSYTVGQVAFSYEEGGGFRFTEGVQQVFCYTYIDTVERDLCQFDTPEGADLFTPAISTEVPGETWHIGRFSSLEGCDSIVVLKVRVHPVYDSSSTAQAHGSYVWPINNHKYTESERNITYSLHTVHGCDSIFTLDLAVIKQWPLPQIFAYKQKVLMLNHSVDGYENLQYPAYRWYRNGKPITNATSDSYMLPEGNIDGCYYIMVPTDATMQYWVYSNTICFGNHGINDIESEDEVSLALMPNPVMSGHTLHVSINADDSRFNGAKIRIYDIQGRLAIEQSAQAENDIQASFVAGVYSVHVLFADGKHAARKLVVR